MNIPDKGRMTHSRYYRRTIQQRPRFFQRVQIDIAFMGQNKKNYGSFFIGKKNPRPDISLRAPVPRAPVPPSPRTGSPRRSPHPPSMMSMSCQG